LISFLHKIESLRSEGSKECAREGLSRGID
jgi:hypothetical protein